MTQEHKDLLLKDLCARLPYGVKLGFYASATKQTYICTLLGLEPQEDEPVIAKTENGSFYMLADHVKSYLFPLSSMSEDLKNELYTNLTELELKAINDEIEHSVVTEFEIDFYHKHHIDYRGLELENQKIEMIKNKQNVNIDVMLGNSMPMWDIKQK